MKCPFRKNTMIVSNETFTNFMAYDVEKKECKMIKTTKIEVDKYGY